MPKPLTRREFLRLAAAAAAPSLLAACSSGPEERVVNFFNWSKYIGKETLPRFTRETGIKVNYEEFADEEEMFAKLRSGARGYDLIVVSDYLVARMKALSLIEQLPPGVLRNAGNIDPKFRNAPFDPDNSFTVPYLWGTTGIGFNRKQVAKPPTSWWDLWDERYRDKMTMLDNVRDCVSLGLSLKGFPETTTDESAFAQVKELFLKQKPLLKHYTSTTYIDGLVAGELALAMGWSGDVLQAARENPDIDYVVPKEGSYMWVDNVCLVRGSRHKEDALLLVDFMLRGEVAAEIANTVRYASPNSQALDHLDKTMLKDPRVFPPRLTAERLKFHAMLDPDLTQQWSETWEDVKVG